MLYTNSKVDKIESALARFLPRLENLRELYVQSLTFSVLPPRQFDKVILALNNCLLKNPIQILHIDEVINFPMDTLPLLPLVHLSLNEVKGSDYFPQPELNGAPHSFPSSLKSLEIRACIGQTVVRSWIANKKLLNLCAITSLTIPSTDFESGLRVASLCANSLTTLTVKGSDGYNKQLDLSLLPELWSLNLNINLYDSNPDSSWVLWLGKVVRTVDTSRFTGGHLKARVFNDTAEVQYDPLKPEVEQFETFFCGDPSFPELMPVSDSDETDSSN
ncbi:hypothetical protein BDQ17DRAFT_1356237 [Cyathus striatus]|nr:hypothetical protein BDQ17DRAFT_1356237 [Cyathus striatus]